MFDPVNSILETKLGEKFETSETASGPSLYPGNTLGVIRKMNSLSLSVTTLLLNR